ncbi:MAG: sulfotransferase [Alicyclobacillus sp.]|nr:sulfotransferase [Alicyclobacillus sp.]
MPPNFLIVGAAKCGTTSLDQYLHQHPDLFMAPRKECNFFAIPEMPAHFSGPGDDVFESNLVQNPHAYENLFRGAKQGQLTGESSVAYLFYPGVAKRIHDANPEAKIIIMLRNPVQRAYSAYMHLVRDGRETLDFMDALKEEPLRRQQNYQPLWMYCEAGKYAEKVKRYLDLFGRDQVHVVLYDDFSRRTQATVRQVFAFLGVRTDIPLDTSARYNLTGFPKGSWYRRATGSNWLTKTLKPLLPASVRRRMRLKAVKWTLERRPMPEEARRLLIRTFRDDIQRLEALLGIHLNHWYA